MELLLLFFGLIVLVIIIVLIKAGTDPKLRKASHILSEYHEKQKTGEIDKPKQIIDPTVYNVLMDKPYNKHNTDDEIIEDILFDLEEYSDCDDYIELPIRGINFRNLDCNHTGDFNGYIAPDKTNKHDPFAIGIYSDDGVLFGYIEKNQEKIHSAIEDKGGFINVAISVSSFTDESKIEKYYGYITILKESLI